MAAAPYETSLDRAGLAIGLGGLICGVFACVMAAVGGTLAPLPLIAILVLGTALAALGITAIAAAPWVLLHIAGRRGPGAAALLGAVIGFLVFLAGQTNGFYLFLVPEMDARTLMFRGLSATVTALAAGALAAGVAVAMWRVAYRRRKV